MNDCPNYLDNLYIFKEKVRSLVPPALLTALATCGMSDTIAFVDAAYPAARCHIGVQCSLVTNLVTNSVTNSVTNLVITKQGDKFVTKFVTKFGVHQIW